MLRCTRILSYIRLGAVNPMRIAVMRNCQNTKQSLGLKSRFNGSTLSLSRFVLAPNYLE